MFYDAKRESNLFGTMSGVTLEKDLNLVFFKNQYYANNWTMKKEAHCKEEVEVDEHMREQLR